MKFFNQKIPVVLVALALGLTMASVAEAKKKHSKPEGVSGTAEVAVAAEASKSIKDTSGNGEALMKKSDCFSCHSVKRKIVGPGYIDVAKKYKGDKTAVAKLTKKVKEGGSGVWGQVPMSAHPDIKDADIESMVQWVLKRK